MKLSEAMSSPGKQARDYVPDVTALEAHIEELEGENKRLAKCYADTDAVMNVLADGRDKILECLQKWYPEESFEIFDKAVQHMNLLDRVPEWAYFEDSWRCPVCRQSDIRGHADYCPKKETQDESS